MVAGGGMHGCWGGAWLLGGVHGCWGGMRGCQGACMVAGGACMVARGACMVARGGAWLLGAGVHGCWGVACVVARGGMHGCRGACMVAGGHAWLPGGVCVPCDLSHHAFDVTCMLPPHQLRLITCAAAYIVFGHVTTHTPPPVDRMTDMCKNITFANYVCGR